MSVVWKSCLLALGALLFSLSIPAGAAAQGGGAVFAVGPARYDPARPETQSYFVYDVEAGRSFHDEVRVLNSGDQPGIVRLYAVDATTGQNSGAVYQMADAPRQGVGSWVTLEAGELRLEPGEERLVGFSVAVPESARPGAHLGGIVAEGATVTRQPGGSDFAVNLQVRSVVAVQLNLPGPRVDRLVVTDLAMAARNGLQVLVVGLRNEGTQMVKGEGSVAILTASGRRAALVPLRLDYVLPGDTLDLPIPIPGQALAAGQYHAELAFVAADGSTRLSFAAPLEVTSAQVEQLYTAQTQLPPRPAPGAAALWASWLPLLCAAASAALFALYLRRRPRAARSEAGRGRP